MLKCGTKTTLQGRLKVERPAGSETGSVVGLRAQVKLVCVDATVTNAVVTVGGGTGAVHREALVRALFEPA